MACKLYLNKKAAVHGVEESDIEVTEHAHMNTYALKFLLLSYCLPWSWLGCFNVKYEYYYLLNKYARLLAAASKNPTFVLSL